MTYEMISLTVFCVLLVGFVIAFWRLIEPNETIRQRQKHNR